MTILNRVFENWTQSSCRLFLFFFLFAIYYLPVIVMRNKKKDISVHRQQSGFVLLKLVPKVAEFGVFRTAVKTVYELTVGRALIDR